jgi:hypothetical protein
MTEQVGAIFVGDPIVEPKRRGGWPRGKPRQAKVVPTPETVKVAADRAMSPMLAKMKARPNWESDDFVGVGYEGADRLHIPPDVVKALYRDGIALQWVTRSVRGQETPQELSKMTKGGWTPVHQSDFDGRLDGMFMPKGVDDPITVEDCLLVARPAEIQAKARIAQRREAARPLQIAEEQLGHGIPNVTGSDHHTATRGNIIKKSMERIEIPD